MRANNPFPCGSLVILFQVLVLTACSGDRVESPPAPQPLCVSPDCGSRATLLAIPDAENLLYTDDDRLFVSGGTGVFELRLDGDELQAASIAPAACNFTGLAQRDDVLYAACFDGQLYAARLTAAPELAPIHTLGIASPNGMVRGPDDALYITNGPLDVGLSLPEPKILRVTFDAADPLRVTAEQDWLASGLFAPNGLAADDHALYVTDSSLLPLVLGRVQRIPFAAEGEPGAPQEIARFAAVLDDLTVVDERLLVTLFSSGEVVLLDPDGEVLQRTGLASFAFPSAVMPARPPLFPEGALLVTEKGLLGETGSSFGNRLSLFAPD